MPAGAYPVQVRGSAVIAGKVVQQPAKVRALVMAALGGLPYPPPNLVETAGAAVMEKTPFDIKFRIDSPEAVRGKPIPDVVELASGKPAQSDLKLISVALPAKVAASIPVLKKRQTSVGRRRAADAPIGNHEFTVAATSTARTRIPALVAAGLASQGQERTRAAPCQAMRIECGGPTRRTVAELARVPTD